jgi:hypothetical protein
MSELELRDFCKIGSALLGKHRICNPGSKRFLMSVADHIIHSMKEKMKSIMDRAYELLDEIKDDGLTCKHPGSSEDDKGQCEFQRSAAILVFLRSIRLPTEKRRASCQDWTVPSHASVYVAAQLMEKRAGRTVSGVAHENRMVDVSKFVQDLGKGHVACPMGDTSTVETPGMSV